MILFHDNQLEKTKFVLINCLNNTNKLCSCWLPWIISYICSILLDIYLRQIENIMYCFLRISWTGFKRKHFKTFLNDYIISSFNHNMFLHRAQYIGNTFIWYFLIGYICNLVNTLSELLFFGIDELQNTLKNTECKISILILPWFLS